MIVVRWARTKDKLPPDEKEVLVIVKGVRRIAEIRWEHPSFEETWRPARYWIDPDETLFVDWEWEDVTHWAELPEVPS